MIGLWVHMVLLVCAFVGFTIFTLVSEPHDPYRQLITYVGLIIGGAWGGLAFIFPLFSHQKQKLGEAVRERYAALLRRPAFLIVGNASLLVAVSVLTYQILMYRQVEFETHRGALILDNTVLDRTYVVGELRGQGRRKFRLRTGVHHLVLLEPASREPFFRTRIIVEPLWRRSPDLRVEVR